MQYSISLNRAHKISERMRQHITDTATQLRLQVAPVRVRSQQDLGAKTRVEERQKNLDVLLGKHKEASAALELLRNAIAKANSSNGVDVLLAKQNRINQELVLAKELNSQADVENSVAWEYIPAVAEEYGSHNLVAINANQAQELVLRARTLQTELHLVSDQVSDANRASFSIDLSDEHAQMVGLKA